jgi:hypothetical protein
VHVGRGAHRSCAVLRWANNLITLQPKCKIDPLLIENALCIFDAYCRAAQEQVSRPTGPPHLHSHPARSL